MSARDSSGAAVRALAAQLNARVVDAGESLSSLDAAADALPERDRPLLRAMLLGSLRWHHRLDWQLAQLLDRPLRRRDGLLAALLRVGLAQIAALRVPDHAAVSATVSASPVLGLGRQRGFVNAVLRRYLRERETLDRRAEAEPVARYSHPAWLIAAIGEDWPAERDAVLAANNELPPFWLRVNRRRTTRDAYLSRLREAGLKALPGPDAADGLLLREPCPVDDLPGFREGLVSVQDLGAQQAASLLQLAAGQRVLDACAAPGGKTAHMLEQCAGLAEVVALDHDPARLEQVAANLDRLGLTATLACADATRPADWFDGRPFDRVLIDAPCSATGVIRRHPDIKLLRRADDIGELAARQGAMLDALWPLVATGGRLVYVTCSILAAENTRVVAAFAARTPGVVVPRFGSAEHYQLLPGQANTDGFYYACLTQGETAGNY